MQLTQLTHLGLAGLIPGMVSALVRRDVDGLYSAAAITEPPTTTTVTIPSPTMPGIIDGCEGFYMISEGDTCDNVAKKKGIATYQLKAWNSEINRLCSNLWLDFYVCVDGPGEETPVPTFTLTPPGPDRPTPEPAPTLPGTVTNCEWFYPIYAGDTCAEICLVAGITFEELQAMNPHINDACTNLWVGYRVCIGVHE
ncbi:LysM peptidoglycan-binding domain-containing protein [Aspergillus undulatus]|uniref:LysM peptidoglycan-binding domain-containing protein n=1 Tax=Aspergillus undulatus TaxID=1810928 RepID=UPI003CCDB235